MGQLLDVVELAVLADVFVLPRNYTADDAGAAVHLHLRNRIEVYDVWTVRHAQRTQT